MGCKGSSPGGITRNAKKPGKTPKTAKRGAESGALRDDLAFIVDNWAGLPPHVRAVIMAIVHEAGRQAAHGGPDGVQVVDVSPTAGGRVRGD